MSQQNQHQEEAVSAYNAFVVKHQWRNFWIHVYDGVFYAMGISLVPAETIMPGFVNECVDRVAHLEPYRYRLVGLLAVIIAACFMMPQQVWAAKLTEGRRLIRRLLVFTALLERMPWLFLGIMSRLVTKNNPELALYLFLALTFSYQFILGIVSPIWQEIVAKTTPVNRRGLLFGIRESIGGVLGFLVLLGANRVVEDLVFPGNYTFLFFAKFVFILLSWIPLFLIKEAEYPVERESRSTREHLRDLWQIVTRDRSFKRYFACRAVFQLSAVASVSFFAVRALDVLGEEGSVSRMVHMGMVIMLSRSVISLFIGPMGDLFGYRLIMSLAAVASGSAIITALLASSVWGFYAAYVLNTFSFLAFWLGHSNYILELAPPEKRPSYIGLDNMSGLPFVAAPFVGGWIADKVSYSVPFLMGAVLAGVAAVMFMTVAVEPRKAMRRDLVA